LFSAFPAENKKIELCDLGASAVNFSMCFASQTTLSRGRHEATPGTRHPLKTRKGLLGATFGDVIGSYGSCDETAFLKQEPR
jgi:hypothetical protein